MKNEINRILKILWTLKEEDKYYFFSYGAMFIESLLDDNEDKNWFERRPLWVRYMVFLIAGVNLGVAIMLYL